MKHSSSMYHADQLHCCRHRTKCPPSAPGPPGTDLGDARPIFCFRYEKATTAVAKQKVTMEVLSYHATAPLDEALRLQVRATRWGDSTQGENYGGETIYQVGPWWRDSSR